MDTSIEGSAVALSRALEAAAAAVSAQWASFREDAASAADVTATVRFLTASVAAGVTGERPAAGAPPSARLARRLLRAIRRQFLGQLARDGGPDGPVLIAYLSAFETVEQQFEPGWDRRFTDRLSGPDGLELVVEVAHDFRSPLTSILFLAETLQRGRSGPVTPLQQRQLGLIYSAAFGLSSVASDVIELARGGDRLIDADPIPFSIQDTLESVRDIVQPMAEEKSLDVRIRPPAGNQRIGQPLALSRVLLNLTTNALKFTERGYVEMAAVERGATAIEFSVTDTGRGIPRDSLAMLFEPFRRRQKERDYAFSGSGLGLSICRKLVEAMGGELQVQTGPSGTRFLFAIELEPVDPSRLLTER